MQSEKNRKLHNKHRIASHRIVGSHVYNKTLSKIGFVFWDDADDWVGIVSNCTVEGSVEVFCGTKLTPDSSAIS